MHNNETVVVKLVRTLSKLKSDRVGLSELVRSIFGGASDAMALSEIKDAIVALNRSSKDVTLVPCRDPQCRIKAAAHVVCIGDGQFWMRTGIEMHVQGLVDKERGEKQKRLHQARLRSKVAKMEAEIMYIQQEMTNFINTRAPSSSCA